MNFFKDLILIESNISSQKEIDHVINMVNSLYNEFKKTGRRKNAVDILTTTSNKLSTIDPNIVDKLHDATKLKLATLLIRCFDIPYWKSVEEKEKIFKRTYRLIKEMGEYDPKTDTGGSVKQIISTRLSASICYNSDNKNIFVSYEPKITASYRRYLFGDHSPEHIYKMQIISVPSDFATFIKELQLNHEKAVKKHT